MQNSCSNRRQKFIWILLTPSTSITPLPNAFDEVSVDACMLNHLYNSEDIKILKHRCQPKNGTFECLFATKKQRVCTSQWRTKIMQMWFCVFRRKTSARRGSKGTWGTATLVSSIAIFFVKVTHRTISENKIIIGGKRRVLR